MQLKDKKILFLGSSVTYGSAAGGYSFVEAASEICGYSYIKEAVSGTTLVDIGDKSYIARLKKIDKNEKIDLFVCQLSTNDAARDFDLDKIEGAIRFILEYVKSAFACPIAFYTGTYYEKPKYGEMVELLYKLSMEYDFYILDLYHDEGMLAVDKEDYLRYMRDPIHPTLEGYKEWWTPKFAEFFEGI